MQAILRGCSVAAWLVLGTSALCAQGPWFVDGVNGVDGAGRGTLAAPWKTIGYAMTSAVPGGSVATSVVYVAGGQMYSQATNGETFPVVLRPGLALEGFAAGASGLPVLQIPVGGTGIELSGSANYLRPTCVLRNLVFSGGNKGIRSAPQGGVVHEPLVENCRFQGQQEWGAWINAGQPSRAITTIRNSSFLGCANGVRAGWDQGELTLESCVFRDTVGHAVEIPVPVITQVPTARIRGCTFEGGITAIRSGYGTRTHVEGCVFRMPTGTGILSGSGHAVVSQCMFVACQTGVDLRTSDSYGSATVADCSFLGGQTGLNVESQGYHALASVISERNFFHGCATGSYFIGESIDARIRGMRAQGCQVGLHCHAFVTVTASSSLFVGNQTGLRLNLFIPGSVFEGLTLADNVTGVHSAAIYDPMQGFTPWQGIWGSECRNFVFSGNVNDLVDFGTNHPPYNPPLGGMVPLIDRFFNSCFQGTNATTNGNLGLTDPLLSRPNYKLLPGSPCIDRVVPTATTPLVDFEGDPRMVAGGVATATPLDLGADEYVPQGSVRSYGTRGVGIGLFYPAISSTVQTARLGTSVPVTLGGAISLLTGQAAGSALLTFGWNDDSGALPMDLGSFGLGGSLLWNDFVTTFPIQPVTAGGTASYGVSIPNLQTLVGLTTTYQWFAIRPDGDIVGSDGLRVTIGQ